MYAKFIKAGGVVLVVLSVGFGGTAAAISTLTQGYLTTDNPPLGAIVSLKSDSTDVVSPAVTTNVNNLIGVVVAANNSLLSVSSSGASNQIQVATSGLTQVLVSNINGSVYAGDEITASPIGGVGMKATDNVKVVGIAQDNLSADASKQSYTDKKGQKHSVMVGEVPVLVNVSYYFKQPSKTLIPQALQNVANALAGKTVNPTPIIISAAIFVVTLIVVVSIIYSMIHGSIISVGRNPMSQSAIYRNLIQMSALVISILGVAVISIYLVLAKL